MDIIAITLLPQYRIWLDRQTIGPRQGLTVPDTIDISAPCAPMSVPGWYQTRDQVLCSPKLVKMVRHAAQA